MEFYRNRKKSVNLILMCTGIFVVLLIIFLYGMGLFTDTVSAKLIAISSIFGLILAFVIIKKIISLSDTSPLVILTREGIFSKVTPVSKAAGLILWKDIIDINLNKVGADTLVTLTVDKPDHYIPKIKQKLSAMAVSGIEDAQGNLPVNLTASELDIDAQELFATITSYKKQTHMI